MPASRRATTNAVVAALTTALGSSALVGNGDRPAGSGWQGSPGASQFRPYVIVWALEPRRLGSLGSPQSMGDFRYQTTSVGGTAEQAEALADKVAAALFDSTSLDVSADVGGATERTDDVDPPVWVSVERFTVHT